MKKTLVSALTTALVVGAASTTFAAANPFSDVPADHWAYDAVSQLAADGVIEGYGDSTFKGNRNITRYEMAQMVAKAMAKNTSGADKALVDKLAAEFAEELNNLGVRVAKLERNADMVKWNGKAEYTFTRNHYEGEPARTATEDRDTNTHKFLFRLEPSAEVNENWHVNARLDAEWDASDDLNTNAATRNDSSKVELKRIWAQGDYKNFTVKAGKFANTIANDLVFDDPFSGIGVVFGGKDLKATVNFGRERDNINFGSTSTYWGIGLNYDASKLSARAGYQHFKFDDWGTLTGLNALNGRDSDGIWSIGAGYRFDKNFAIDATYARSNFSEVAGVPVTNEKTAFAYGVSYKGAEAANKGTWGAWVGYRYLGTMVALDPTYDVVKSGFKGLELGVKYVPWKNIVTQVQYGTGKRISDNQKYNTLFGRVEFLF
ncbi:S-layer homology domain-containing protein [Selenomonas ruminantium]|uniref:S-layer homology domain-containing protein n=1 Tax=Selenomonas ruminantium TaxID=971 RepID=UPI00047CB87C|nr:S-layer homology domain-containing protein [Selenomonas ruminantium]